MALSMTSRHVSNTVVLDLSGKLSVLERSLREKINAHLEEGRRHFVLNLEAVTYVDSDGIGQLISVWTSVRSADGHLTLVHPGQRLQEILRITKLNTVFEVFHDESYAVRAAQAPLTSSLRNL